jgi:hypothetical protein
LSGTVTGAEPSPSAAANGGDLTDTS